ncbi:MAG TPA: ABC transporter permease [Solirubrobacteraceae bacterium]|nr:ABC transporter permease [Solirubrobacteraceae bacterium]
MRPLNALALYRARLRARLWQECFAVAGIAAGVALLFASQVSTSSLQGSVARLSRGIAGAATLQLQARDPHGLPGRFVDRVRSLPGVRSAAPVLEADANAIGPRGAKPVELIGADGSLSRLGGTLTRGTELRPFAGIGAVVLSAPVASAIGVGRFGQEVNFQLAGRAAEAPLYVQPHMHLSAPLASGAVALVPLSTAQEMTGSGARVSRVLVRPAAGMERLVEARLRALAGDRLNVEPIAYEERLFANAATASNQSSRIFSAISALVGFLFAFNAMLFTVPQRRRLVLDLRREGYGSRTVIALLLLDAAALGLVGCALGLALGEELSIHVFHPNPAFLSLAFPLGGERVVGWQSIAAAVGGGMLAATVAVLSPLRDILTRHPPSGIAAPERSAANRASGRAALAGVLCVLAATAVLLAQPDAAIPGMVLLLAALLLVLPGALGLALALVRRLAGRVTGVVPHVAAMELSAAGARAIAIAATAAVAIFGSVAIRGAHDDLLAGLERAARDMNASAGVWVAPAGSYDLMNTTPFVARERATLEAVPGVRAVLPYRGGMLDYGERRALVIAPSPQAVPRMLARQIVTGDAGLASARVRRGGWLVLSKALAHEHHLRVGDAVRLPSPLPTALRVAAISTNFGWAPGAILMNASDYARAWASDDVSAYDLLLARGASPARSAQAVRRALGPHSGLAAQTAGERADEQDALSREALAQLSQIAALIPIAAVLAAAAAIGAMIRQRRPRLAKLRLEGLPRGDLWLTILFESLLLLGVGCALGALFGVYGQQLADRALAETVNFPVVHSIAAPGALSSLVLVPATALAILAIPGYLAASVPASLALQD